MVLGRIGWRRFRAEKRERDSYYEIIVSVFLLLGILMDYLSNLSFRYP